MNKKVVFIPILSIILFIFCCACNSQNTDLQDYKDIAKEQITSYVQNSNYNKELHGFVYEILDEYVNQIDSSDSKEEIDAIVKSGEEKIIKTYKMFAKSQITSQAQKFNYFFNEELNTVINEILNQYKSQIDSASSKKEIDFQMDSAKKEINMHIKNAIAFDSTIEFKCRPALNLYVKSPKNIIIRSRTELEKFLDDSLISEENRAAFKNYNEVFLMKMHLFFAYIGNQVEISNVG